MKRKTIFIAAIFAFILIAGCTANSGKENSIFSEIIIDGDHTYVKGIEAGMSSSQVLSALGLTENDVEISTFESDAIPGVKTHTHVTTKEAYHYKELDEPYGFEKVFIFYDDKIHSMGYRCVFDGVNPEDAYESAISFMNGFIKSTGAKPVENAEGFEYHTYGSPEKESFSAPNAYYHCQFFNGGPLGEIAINTRDTSSMQHMYKGDLTVHLGISFNFNQRPKEI